MDAIRRKRRRKRRIIASVAFLAVALGLSWFFESQSTTTVIFVSFAETEQPGVADSDLSIEGRERAAELARVLQQIDVVRGLDAIFATQHRSTRQTAEPVAELLQIPVQTMVAENIKGLRDLVLKEYRGKIILVVSLPEIMPALIKKFYGSKNVSTYAENEYDRIYVHSVPWYGKEKTLELRYGRHYEPE